MISPREQGFPQGLQEPLQAGSSPLGNPLQQPLQGFAQPYQQLQQGMPGSGFGPGFAQFPMPPQQGITPLAYVQQPQQGLAQAILQAQQGMQGYVRPFSPQGVGQPAFLQPAFGQQPQPGFSPPFQQVQQGMPGSGYLQPLPPQGLAQAGYLQQTLQGGAPAGFSPQQFQPGAVGRGEQIQQGMAQPVFGPGFGPLQPQPFFGQGGTLPAGGYDVFPQAGRGQPDVPRARRGPKNYARSDERIRELICERLTQDLSIDVSDVGVDVQGGRVSLSGTVPDRQMKHAIEDVVDNCWGVQDIENGIHVQFGQEPGAAARGPGGQQGRGMAQAGGGFASSTAAAAGTTAKPATGETKGRSKEE